MLPGYICFSVGLTGAVERPCPRLRAALQESLWGRATAETHEARAVFSVFSEVRQARGEARFGLHSIWATQLPARLSAPVQGEGHMAVGLLCPTHC